MSKVSCIQRNKHRERLVSKAYNRRKRLKTLAADLRLTPEERFDFQAKLSKMPRNTSSVRLCNRCELTGRPRSYYRRFRMSRIMFRSLASSGKIPGVLKSSW